MNTRDVKWEWSGDLVPIGDGRTQVPSRATVTGPAYHGAPDLHAEFEVREGVPECVSFSLTSKGDGRGIRTADLRNFEIDGFVWNAFRHMAFRVPDDTQTGQAVRPKSEKEYLATLQDFERSRAPHRTSVAELEEVARVYRANLAGKPTEAVQHELAYSSHRTAVRRISQARAAGLLPPTTPGKKGA